MPSHLDGKEPLRVGCNADDEIPGEAIFLVNEVVGNVHVGAEEAMSLPSQLRGSSGDEANLVPLCAEGPDEA